MKYFLSFIIILGVFFSVGIYKELNKKSPFSKRIACHKKTVVFEKILKPYLIKELKDTLSLDTTLEISFDKSEYMKSTLFDYVSKEDIKNLFKKHLKKHSLNKKLDRNTSINILVYENDKKSPNKKSKNCKFYRGYLVVDFNLENQMIYKIQIDFYDEQGKDIKDMISCIFKTLQSI